MASMIWWRSIVRPPCRRSQGVVASAIGDRLDRELQGIGRDDAGRGWRLPAAGEDRHDDVAVCDTGRERLDTRRLDGRQPVLRHAAEHFDELAIAIVMVL